MRGIIGITSLRYRPRAVSAAYGGNYERLAQVKGACDPGNFFRLNHNIAPPGAGTGERSLVGAPAGRTGS